MSVQRRMEKIRRTGRKTDEEVFQLKKKRVNQTTTSVDRKIGLVTLCKVTTC